MMYFHSCCRVLHQLDIFKDIVGCTDLAVLSSRRLAFALFKCVCTLLVNSYLYGKGTIAEWSGRSLISPWLLWDFCSLLWDILFSHSLQMKCKKIWILHETQTKRMEMLMNQISNKFYIDAVGEVEPLRSRNGYSIFSKKHICFNLISHNDHIVELALINDWNQKLAFLTIDERYRKEL